MTLRETRKHVMQLIPLLSTLEPQPSPNGAPGLGLLTESPVSRRRQAGLAHDEAGCGAHGSTAAGQRW